MVNRLFTLMFAFAFVLSLSAFAQEGSKEEEAKETPAQEKAEHTHMGKSAKAARWEGIVNRTSPDKSTLTVRKRGSNFEKIVHYDNSTQFTSQEHGSKKINTISANDVKEGDRVISIGQYDDKGDFHATLISKRLTR